MNIPTQHTKINIVSYQIARFTDVFQWISWLHNFQAVTNMFHYLSGHLPNMKNKWINNVKLKGNIVNVCCIRCNWNTWRSITVATSQHFYSLLISRNLAIKQLTHILEVVVKSIFAFFIKQFLDPLPLWKSKRAIRKAWY